MIAETRQERSVRRKLNEYYGTHLISTVEKIDDDEYRARLLDGDTIYVFLNQDGSIDVREEYAGC